MDALLRQVPRPISPGELASVADFPLGTARVCPSQRRIAGPSRTAHLQPRVMQVLVLLADCAGQVVSRETLLDRCWGGVYVGDDSLNRVIAALRKVAGEIADNSFEIETIPRVGYRLLADADVPAAGGSRSRSRRRLLVPLLAVLVVALVIVGIWYGRGNGEPALPKIAVLPFTSLNADADAANFGASIAATVATALAQTGVRLPDGVRTVDEARKSGAAVIVSGAVRRDGSTFRVTARVDSARDRSTILMNEFQAETAEAPTLAGRVAAWLTPPVRMWASFTPVEPDPRTTEEILRIFLTRQGGDGLRAWELSRSLAAAKPGSGAAQLVTALLTSDVLALIAPDQRRSAVDGAQRAATGAARLLPDPARALAVRDCHLEAPGWQILTPQCDRRTRAAISANPDVPLLPFLFGWQLAGAGRFDEAVKFADMDLAQSPLGSGQLALRIFATRMARSGDTDGVLPPLEQRMRRYAGPAGLAYFDFRVAVANGDMRAADAVLNPPAGSQPGQGHPWDGMDAIADGNARATMELVIRAVRSKSPKDVVAVREGCNPSRGGSLPSDPAFGTCLVGLTLLGDLDAVFALAHRGYRDVECCSAAQQREQWLASGGVYYPRWELFGAAMAPVRADPRFVELARRTGLLAYWKSGQAPDFCSFERAPVCRLLSGTPTAS